MLFCTSHNPSKPALLFKTTGSLDPIETVQLDTKWAGIEGQVGVGDFRLLRRKVTHDFSAEASTSYIPAWTGSRPDPFNYLTLGSGVLVMYHYFPRYAGATDAGWVYSNAPDTQTTGWIPDSSDVLAKAKAHSHAL